MYYFKIKTIGFENYVFQTILYDRENSANIIGFGIKTKVEVGCATFPASIFRVNHGK